MTFRQGYLQLGNGLIYAIVYLEKDKVCALSWLENTLTVHNFYGA